MKYYELYFFDNDGQRRIIGRVLGYTTAWRTAARLSTHYNTDVRYTMRGN